MMIIQGFKHRFLLLTAISLMLSFSAQQSQNEAHIKFLIGKVEILASQQTAWRSAALNQVVKSGDRLRTTLNSRVELELPDGSVIKINENTIFDVKEIKTQARDKQDKMSFTLWAGNLWAQFQKVVDTRQQRQIESPSAVVAIRGTTLEMNVDQQQTTLVRVFEGQVGVASKDVAGEVIVSGNQESFVEKGKAPSVPRSITTQQQTGDQSRVWDFHINMTQFQFTDTAILMSGLPIDGKIPPGASITANGVPLNVTADGQFSGRIPVQEGLNEINVSAQRGGQSQSKSLRVFVNTKRPEIRLSKPITAGFFNRRDYSLSGAVFDPTPGDKVKVFINNELVSEAQQQGAFNRTVILNEGKNDIRVSAQDISKNTTELAEQIFLDTVKPIVTITEPAQPVFVRFEPPRPPSDDYRFNEERFTQQIRGLIIDPEPSSGIRRMTINGKEIKPNSDGTFTADIILMRSAADRKVAAAAENRLQIFAEDLAGNIYRDNSRVIIIR